MTSQTSRASQKWLEALILLCVTGIHAWAATREVFPGISIQAVIDSASHSDEIVLSPGHYSETINLKGKNLTLRSVDPSNPEVVETTIIGTGQSGAVVTINRGENSGCLIHGLTISSTAPNSVGVVCGEGSPRFVNCRIIGNSGNGVWSGGGDFSGNSGPYFLNCVIQGNGNAGVQSDGNVNSSVFLRLENCRICENGGAGVVCNGIAGAAAFGFVVKKPNRALLEHCVIESNFGPGIQAIGAGSCRRFGGVLECSSPVYVYSSPRLLHCVISNNHSGGCRFLNLSAPLLRHCLIARNTCPEDGGAVYGSGTTAQLLNCTIVDNSSEIHGVSGVVFHWSEAKLTNCILKNEDEEYWGDGRYFLTYCCIEGGWPGLENFDADPRFVDPEHGDYRLAPDSPCIDTGNPDVSYNDACIPPGLGTERNDRGAFGGPYNCGWNDFPFDLTD